MARVHSFNIIKTRFCLIHLKLAFAKLLENKLDIFRFSLKLNKLYDGSHYVTQPNRIKKQAVLANKLI